MPQPVIVEAVRTPIGKRNGWLSGLHAAHLPGSGPGRAGEADRHRPGRGRPGRRRLRQPGRRAGVEHHPDGMADAGLPFEVAATTVDCQCGSSQQATHFVNDLVAARVVDVAIACGVELMSRVPLGTSLVNGAGKYVPASFPCDMKDQFGAPSGSPTSTGSPRQTPTGSASSRRRGPPGLGRGPLRAQIVAVDAPVSVKTARGHTGPTPRGDCRRGPPRDDGREARRAQGGRARRVHTAGGSSQISDGAAAVLWMTRAGPCRGPPAAGPDRRHLLVGSDPYYHHGPIDATDRVLRKAGMTMNDIDLSEINEAFASVVLSWAEVHVPTSTRSTRTVARSPSATRWGPPAAG